LSDRARKRREIADKLAADIARLAKEIADRRRHLADSKRAAQMWSDDGSWFAKWSRHIMPLARAVGALHRATHRLPGAKERAHRSTMQAREKATRLARIKAANVGYMKVLDRIKDGAAEQREQWRRERKEEEKRIRKLSRQLEKRNRKDYTARPDWMQKPVTLPPPIQQPDLTIHHDALSPAPPREGLIPGTFTVMDPARIGTIVDRPRLPKVWTATYVGARLIEAHKVLLRLPASIWPKGYGAAWPLYKIEAGEAAIQAGAGTLAIGRHSRPRTASADAVARMNEAISWPMQYLSNRPGAAYDVNSWAADAAFDQMDFDARSAPWVSLQIIADALNAAKEVVT
jgi:hypothetical protein